MLLAPISISSMTPMTAHKAACEQAVAVHAPGLERTRWLQHVAPVIPLPDPLHQTGPWVDGVFTFVSQYSCGCYEMYGIML